MVTFFTTTKPFQGHIGTIQRNALRSWTQLQPRYEIILFGNEYGATECAAALGLRHEPEVATNDLGTPLVSDMFLRAQTLAQYDQICYANADIMFMSDFCLSVEVAIKRHSKYLLVGQRWDVDITEELQFEAGWEAALRKRVASAGTLHLPWGVDYFVFRRGQWTNLPHFAIGRVGYDNWLIYAACRMGWPVIDMSRAITAVHQNHDYAHLAGGIDELRQGAEAKRNRELMGSEHNVFTVEDATWLMGTHGPVRAWTRNHMRRRLSRWLARHPSASRVARLVRKLAHKAGRRSEPSARRRKVA